MTKPIIKPSPNDSNPNEAYLPSESLEAKSIHKLLSRDALIKANEAPIISVERINEKSKDRIPTSKEAKTIP
jgi:hypothetical protein